MRQVLVVCPQPRDPAAGVRGDLLIRHGGHDLDAGDVDPAALLEELAVEPVQGVIGTKDRSALLAALVAERRSLLGPSPAAILRCQHKPTSRALQRTVAPESTPASALLGEEPPGPPPWFVKPVVGRLSQEARRVEEPAELTTMAPESAYRVDYARVAALAGLDPAAAHGFLVEELVGGEEVTLEGYVRDGAVTVVGITDSVKYAGTNSFERFEYPSALPAERIAELGELARLLVAAHGLDHCFFNVEFLVPAAGPVQIVELNPRIASQFAPLVEAVHGRSTYDLLLDLVCGDDPAWDPSRGSGVAISYVVRVFEDGHVEAVPEPEPGLEVLVAPGRMLSEHGSNDSVSYRLAIFSAWGETRELALHRCRERARSLAFRLSGRGDRGR